MQMRLLQTPSLQVDDGQTTVLPPNDAALLAVLAIDGPTSREAMAQLLWPDSPGDGARANLRQRIRRFKTTAGLVLDSGGRQLLALPAQPVLTHDLQDLSGQLEADPLLGSGELLGACAYDDNPSLASWVQHARAQWRAARLRLLADIAERHEREQHISRALPYALQLVQDDPMAEHAHRRVMRLHYLRGDRSGALAAYDRLRAVLRDELGTIPSRETLELARLIDASGALRAPSVAAQNVAALRPPQLIGRDGPGQQLNNAWAQAGAVVLVSGDAGIGKSRFINDMADALGISLRVQALRGDAGVAYALLGRLLRAAAPATGGELPTWARGELARVVPEWGEPPVSLLVPLRLAQAARLVLGAHTALLLDDLHAADAATLELLPLLATPPLRCLFAARLDEMPGSSDGWLTSSTPGKVVHIALAPLDEPAVAALLRSLALPELESARWAGVLMQHTGGHPLFLLETVREIMRSEAAADVTLRLPLPTEVGRLIERRFDALSPVALKLMRLAALAGQDFSVALAMQVLHADALTLVEPWAELESSHLLSVAGFAHDLVQAAAAKSIPRPIALALHHAIATELEKRGGAPARIAPHWVEAQEWAAAARHWEGAAAHARLSARRSEELALLDDAARCLDRCGDRANAFRLGVLAVDAAIVAEPANHAAERATALTLAARNDEEQLDAWLAKAKCAGTMSDYDRGDAPAERAFQLAQRCGDERRRLLAACLYASGKVSSGDAETGMRVFEDHIALADAQPDPLLQCEFSGHYAVGLHAVGRFAEAAERMQRAATLQEQFGDLNTAMIESLNATTCLYALGDLAGAVELIDHALALWTRQGEPTGVPAAATHMTAGMVYATVGRHVDALHALEWSLAQFRCGSAAIWAHATEHVLALTFLRLGQSARASQALSPLDLASNGQVRGRRAIVEWLITRREQRAITPALHDAVTTPPPDVRALDRLSFAISRAFVLPPDEALSELRVVQAKAQLSHPTVALHALVREAELLHGLSRHADALAAIRRAVAAAAGCFAKDVDPVELWWLAFCVFEQSGAADEAAHALREGLAVIERELPQVPEPFRESFLHRNPFNRDLLAAARRHGLR